MMAEPNYRPVLRLNTQHVTNEYHNGPFSQCKACQLCSPYSTSPRHLSAHNMTTRSTTTTAARQAVFNTHELLENILLHLPEASVVTARLVTIHWNAIIMTSPAIRRKLFLDAQPVRPSQTWTAQYKADGKAQDKPEDLDTLVLYLTVPAKLNPLLFKPAPADRRDSLAERIEEAEKIYLVAKPRLDAGGDGLHWNMLVCQPPATHLVMEWEFYHVVHRGGSGGRKKTRGRKSCRARYSFRHQRRLHSHRVVREVRNEDGVRFGDVLKEFRAGVQMLGWSDADVSIRAGCGSFLRMTGVVFATDKEEKMVREGLF